MLFQRDVDRGKGIHSPAGVLVPRRKHSLHEHLYKPGEAAFDNALPHGVHQGELQRDTLDELRNADLIIDLWGNHLVSLFTFRLRVWYRSASSVCTVYVLLFTMATCTVASGLFGLDRKRTNCPSISTQ